LVSDITTQDQPPALQRFVRLEQNPIPLVRSPGTRFTGRTLGNAAAP
jgi:hypothetical protein